MDKKECRNRKEWMRFIMEEDGVGVVEVVLILVVLVGLVLIFKGKLTALMNSIFSTITERAGRL